MLMTSLNVMVLVVMATLITSSRMTSVPLIFDPVGHQPCDVTIWDATKMSSQKLVHSVNVACTEGEVTWRFPHGGLRVSFTPPPDDDDVIDNVTFDVCCVVSVTYCDVTMSLDDGASLRVIAVLKSSSSSLSSDSMELCFQSSIDRAVSLYLESLTSHVTLVVGRLVVDYDVRRHDNASSSCAMDQCRPCSDTELLEAACMSDFTVEGRMLNVTSKDAGWTTINVAVTNVIHETTHFVDLLSSVGRDLTDKSDDVERRLNRELILPLRTAPVCRVRRGDGLFVFVGNIRLKRTLHIHCAPRLDDFRRTWFSAVERQLQPCRLPVT